MKKELCIKIHFILCMLLVFFMPLLPIALPLLIILLALNRLLCFDYTGLNRNSADRTALILFSGLYLAYLAGMLYTVNMQAGLKDIETKLSLFIFPVLLFFSWSFDNEQVKKLLRVFIAGCVVSAVYSFGSSLYDYYRNLEAVRLRLPDAWDFGVNTFLASRLTKHFHPSYLSMYVNLAIMAVFYINDWPRKQLSRAYYALVIFLAVYVFFINAKSGMLFLTLLILLYGYLLVFRMKKIKEALMIAAGFIVFASILWVAAPEFSRKIKAAVNAAMERGGSVQANESSSERRMIWSTASGVIKEHLPLGAGTGDSKDVLLERYREIGFMSAYNEKLNCHNQFLQTMVAIGLPGILFLAGGLLFAGFFAIKHRRYLQLLFVLLIIVNFLSEAMLETQAGVIFFAFFNSLFMFSPLRGQEQ